jgi:EAL domain-containing protein (putative c-di-GMP-specific phosphodiesterase class I)
MSYRSYLNALTSESGASLRALLFDGVTGLGTLPLMLESLHELAAEQHKLGVIFIDTGRLDPLEEEYGWEMVDELLQRIRGFLDGLLYSFPPLKMYAMHRVPGDNFCLIVFSSDPQHPVTFQQIAHVSTQLEEQLNRYILAHFSSSVIPFARLFTGFSILEYNSSVRFERLAARAVNRAFSGATSQQERVRQMQVQQLQEIVNGNQIRVLFQPIFDLSDIRHVMGYEILSRGPEGTVFEGADFMFSLAGNCGLLGRLENQCQLQILSALEGRPMKELIFVNLEPSFLENDQYQKLALFQSPNLDPKNVVLEVTERIAITDFDVVLRSLESIRNQGFRIAVDDVGNGYASLQSIAYLRPDFIKINDTMIHGISHDFIKQEIVKTLCDLASRISASVIAEGIEQEKDLKTLQELNVGFGQGYLLKRPSTSLLE